MKIFGFFKKTTERLNSNQSESVIEKSDSKSKTESIIEIKPDSDFEFVHVEEDGSVRELTREERGYLKEEFAPTDGARPYIKFRYKSKTPDNKLWGFLPRKKVPKNIEIENIKMDKETWRRNWILIIKDLTNLEYQKRTWLDSKNTNPYYSFIEFMCSYFDDLDLSDGYEKHIESELITKTEYEIISDWHKLLSEYESPNSDDYDNRAVLNDKNWLKIIDLGKKSLKSLKPNLDKFEQSLLI